MSIEWSNDLHFDALSAAVHAKLPLAAMKAMEHVREEVARQTPIETGHLVGSEDVQPTAEGADIYIPGPYARAQHFNLDWHHNTGNALYLELPMITKAPEALQIIADEIRGEI